MKKAEISIMNILSSFRKESGTTGLFKIVDATVDLGDESGSRTIVYAENARFDDPDFIQFSTQAEQIYARVERLEIDGYKKSVSQNVNAGTLRTFWLSDTNDWINFQVSDQHVHLTFFYSGQY